MKRNRLIAILLCLTMAIDQQQKVARLVLDRPCSISQLVARLLPHDSGDPALRLPNGPSGRPLGIITKIDLEEQEVVVGFAERQVTMIMPICQNWRQPEQ